MPIAVSPTPAGPPPVPRPILSLDVASAGREEMIVTTAVYSDGRDVGEVAQAPGLVWAPDGVRFSYVAEDGKSVRVGDIEGDEKIVLQSDNEWYPMYQWPAWSPDGRRIAAINVAWCEVGMYVSSIEVIDAEIGGSVARHGPYDFWQAYGTLEGPTRFSSPNKISWSRDGQKVLISWDKAVVIDAVTGKPEVVTSKPVLAEWAPGSDAIYYFEIKRGEVRRNLTLGAFYVKKLGADSPELLINEQRVSEMGLSNAWSPIPGALALSPSGGKIAMTGGGDSEGNSVLYVFDLTGELQSSFESSPESYAVEGHIAALDWAPDDEGVAALVSTDAGVSVDTLDLATGEWTTVTTSKIEMRQIEFLGKAISWSQ